MQQKDEKSGGKQNVRAKRKGKVGKRGKNIAISGLVGGFPQWGTSG